jgi:hypothetical protein
LTVSCENGNETSGTIKCWEARVAAQLAASKEGLSSMNDYDDDDDSVNITSA